MSKTLILLGVLSVLLLTMSCDIYQPEISIVSPKEGQVYSGFYKAYVPIEIEVTDNEAVAPPVLILDNDTIYKDLEPPIDTFVFLDEGTRLLTVIAYDKAGNWIRDSISFSTLPYSPKQIADFELPEPLADLELNDDTLWIMCGSSGSGIVEVGYIDLKQLPNTPTMSSMQSLPHKSPLGMDIDKEYLYFVAAASHYSDTTRGLRVYRRENVLTFTLVGCCNPSSSYYETDVVIRGNTAFIAGGSSKNLYLVDISDKSNPVVADSIALNYEPLRVSSTGNYLAVTSLYDVSVFNISNLENLSQVASFDLPGGGYVFDSRRAEPFWDGDELYIGGSEGLYLAKGFSSNVPTLDEIGDVKNIHSVVKANSTIFMVVVRDFEAYPLSEKGEYFDPFKVWSPSKCWNPVLGEIIIYNKYILFGASYHIAIFQFEE